MAPIIKPMSHPGSVSRTPQGRPVPMPSTLGSPSGQGAGPTPRISEPIRAALADQSPEIRAGVLNVADDRG